MMKRMTLSEKRTISVPCSSPGSSSGGASGYSFNSSSGSGYSSSSSRKANSGRMERPEAVSCSS